MEVKLKCDTCNNTGFTTKLTPANEDIKNDLLKTYDLFKSKEMKKNVYLTLICTRCGDSLKDTFIYK